MARLGDRYVCRTVETERQIDRQAYRWIETIQVDRQINRQRGSRGKLIDRLIDMYTNWLCKLIMSEKIIVRKNTMSVNYNQLE